MIFFSLLAAPALFGGLPRDLAGRAVSAIFPRYYGFGAACGLIALVTGLVLRWRRGAPARALAIELLLVALMTGIVLYSGRVLLPQASRARAALAGPGEDAASGEAQRRFAALHRRSVMLNGAVLLLGVAAFALAAMQSPLRPPGPGPSPP